MKSPITTHILDTAKGVPASDVSVKLVRLEKQGAVSVAQGKTNEDGRIMDWFSRESFSEGHYQITFDTRSYLEDGKCFFPEVTIDFIVDNLSQHYHVPLLLSPFGYSTYRGS